LGRLTLTESNVYLLSTGPLASYCFVFHSLILCYYDANKLMLIDWLIDVDLSKYCSQCGRAVKRTFKVIITLWLWPSSLWRWMSVPYRLWCDQTHLSLYLILAISNNPRPNYSHLMKISAFGASRWAFDTVSRPFWERFCSLYSSRSSGRKPLRCKEREEVLILSLLCLVVRPSVCQSVTLTYIVKTAETVYPRSIKYTAFWQRINKRICYVMLAFSH